MTNTFGTTSNKAGAAAAAVVLPDDDDTRETSHPYQDLISLRSIQVNENRRRVAFATVNEGAENAVLFFYATVTTRVWWTVPPFRTPNLPSGTSASPFHRVREAIAAGLPHVPPYSRCSPILLIASPSLLTPSWHCPLLAWRDHQLQGCLHEGSDKRCTKRDWYKYH